VIFHGRNDDKEEGIYRFESGSGRGMPGHRESSPACRLPDFRRRSGCVPAEPYPPLKQPTKLQSKLRLAIGPKHYSTFVRTAPSTFVRTTTAQSVRVAMNSSHRAYQPERNDRRHAADGS
jgi:hypothetical protein